MMLSGSTSNLRNGSLSTIVDSIGIWDLSYSQLNKFLKDLIHACHHVRPSKFSEVINTQYSMHEASVVSFLFEINYTVVMFISENKLQISIFSLTSHFRVLVIRALRLECGTEWLLKALLTEAIQWVYAYIFYSKQFKIIIWIWHCLIRMNIYEQKKTHLNPFMVNGLTSLMSD